MSQPTILEKSLASTFPTGEIAWDGMQNGTMRKISDGLAVQVERDRQNGKSIITDFFPETTTLTKEWEETFRLPNGELLTASQRKARLIATWTKKSPATYSEMNEIYALSGFNIIARPLLPTEDPRVIATTDVDVLYWDTKCGVSRTGPNTRTGAFTIDTGTVPPIIFADGRPGESVKNYITKCGVSRTGEISNSSRCGNFEGSRVLPPVIVIPNDDWTWPLIYILEDESGDFAQIPVELKEAYEFLTYKMKPNFMWAISRVEYIEMERPIETFIKITPDEFIKMTPDGFIKTVDTRS